MSRDKENNALPALRRQGIPLPSALSISGGDEFFTDSILDNSDVSSRIPSPSPKKAVHGRPRRAIGTTKVVARHLADATNRTSRPASSLSSAQNRGLQYPPVLTKPKPRSPKHLDELTTPPQSRDGLPLQSPFSDRSSPPRDLTESYQRIADEEDLAHTERDLEDSNEEDGAEDEVIEELGTGAQEDQVSPARVSERPSVTNTPTQDHLGWNKENFIDDRIESMSEASGLSFLQQMTDQNLAAKLTPGFVNHHKDKQILRRALFSEQPIVFNRTGRPIQETPHFEKAGKENAPPDKLRAFSLASKFDPKPSSSTNGVLSTTPDSDPPPRRLKAFALADEFQASQNSKSQREQNQPFMPRLKAFSLAGKWKNPAELDQQNESTARPNESETGRGGSAPHHPLTEKNLERKDGQREAHMLNGSSTESVTTTHSEPLPQVSRQFKGAELIAKNFFRATRGRARDKLGMAALTPPREASRSASPVDWVAAAADVPLPSVEDSSTPKADVVEGPVGSAKKNSSPGKMSRWDTDLTGVSFQVSQSPPVRNKNVSADTTLDKEIEVLTKQGITRNRLGQLRERESFEHLRSSRSPSFASGKRLSHENEDDLDQEREIAVTDEGKPIPDTPVVVYKSYGSSQEQRASEIDAREQPLNALQRLARMSATPRSSPYPEVAEQVQGREESAKRSISQRRESELSELSALGGVAKSGDRVAETPRITGSWTDTVLPDTIKTTKQLGTLRSYAQTPHVNAGGWVDTPILNGVGGRQFSNQAPEVIQELTEELSEVVNGDNHAQADEDNAMVKRDSLQVIPKSALTNIIDNAKSGQARIVSQDITDGIPSGHDETTNLNLGDATLQSLEGLLDADEMSTFLRLGAEDGPLDLTGIPQSEAEVLERLGTKLDHMRHSLHDTRKGISRLEHQVAKPSKHLALAVNSEEACPTCGVDTSALHSHSNIRLCKTTVLGASLPYLSIPLSLPIPLLFRSRKASQLVPRPTLLGYMVLAVYVWYLLECTLCEMYCHPTHAVRYSWPREPEPIFPLVLPTMLGRWSRNVGLFSVWNLLVAIGRMVGMLTGWTDGFADNSTGLAGLTDVIGSFTDAPSTDPGAGAGGEGWSMMGDEML